MSLTSIEVVAGSLATMGSVGFVGWIKAVANRVIGLESRLKTLEDRVSKGINNIEIHENSLSAGERRMNELKADCAAMKQGIVDLQLMGQKTLTEVDGLSTQIKTGMNEMFLIVNPRLERNEERIVQLETDINS